MRILLAQSDSGRPVSPSPAALLHGTLDALILKTLSWGPRHGYAIARWLEQITGEVLQIEEGSLYPALYRLERRGLIDSEWGTSELNRRARFYQLTDAGRARLMEETEEWTRFTDAVSRVLRHA
jgi:PadR family transcriptional regulator PadR